MLVCEPSHNVRLKRVYLWENGPINPHSLKIFNFFESDNLLPKPCHMKANSSLEERTVYSVSPTFRGEVLG